jgi:tetratricopeptide (TPR) repeat protein
VNDTNRAVNWADIVRENPWLVPALGVAGVSVTFATAGLLWGLLGIYVLLVLAIIALANSLRMSRGSRAQSTGDGKSPRSQVSAEQTGELVDQLSAQPVVVQAGELTAQEQGAVASGALATASETHTKESDPVVEAIIAAGNSDPTTVRSALEPWIRDATNRDEEKAREAQMLYWLVRAGDEGQLTNLRSLTDTNPALPDPALYFAQALSDLGEPLEAADELDQRLSSIAESERPRVLIVEARLRRSAGRPRDAEARAARALGSESISTEIRAEALAELGYAFEDDNRKLDAFAFFEQSLELDPTQRVLRFHLAYEYAVAGFHEPAIAHYEALVDRDESGAKNNLGIQFLESGLPATGVVLLKQSALAGTSLAAGNLAMNLVEAGYFEEARPWIERGRGANDTHARVEEAALTLAARPTEEDAVLRDIRARGRDLRQVFRLLATEQNAIPEGTWHLSTGFTITFVAKGNSSSGAVGAGANKVTIDFGMEGGHLSIRQVVGEYVPSTSMGLAAWDGDRVLAYLKGWPSAHWTSPITLTKVSVPKLGSP